MEWRAAPWIRAEVRFPCKIKGSGAVAGPGPVTPASTPVELSTDLLSFPRVWINLWITSGVSLADRYFHCVETTNPPAMKPKPTTMFQLPRASMGSLLFVT